MRVLYWFRKDLRLQDNINLLKTIDKATELIPLYIFHPPTLPCGPHRWNFLIETLQDLHFQLQQFNSQLWILHGDPSVLIPEIIEKYQIDRIGVENIDTPHGQQRDAAIFSALTIPIQNSSTNLLYDHSKVHKVYTYQSFWNQVKFQTVASCVEVLRLPPFPAIAEYAFTLPNPKPSTTHIKGGSSEAWTKLETYCKDYDRVKTFEKPKTSPVEWNPPSTTGLSPYLVWGCLSCRQVYHAIRACCKKSNKTQSLPPVSLIGQLIWRDFYYYQGIIVPNYEFMQGNPICKQIPWKKALNPDDAGYDELQQWKNGETGFPFIDALMIQLKTTGWMHHLGRHVVACFLTRGDLFIHWERGKEHFQEYLIDHDWSLNVGNWLWLSASAYFSRYFHVYGPVSFPKKYPNSDAFIRHFLPILQDVPEKYILEPWKMTKAEQKKYNCVIGKDYPFPLGDHKRMSQACMAKMKEAYSKKRKASDS